MSATTRELEAELFGRETRFEYSEHWIGYSLVLLRVVMGWVLLQGGLFAGLPVAHGWVVDDHVVYAVLLFGLGAFGAGRILGIDAYLEDREIVRNNGWLRLFLG